MGRKPIVISHKAHPSLAVKIVQLFPSLGRGVREREQSGRGGFGPQRGQLQQLRQSAEKIVTLLASALLLSHSGPAFSPCACRSGWAGGSLGAAPVSLRSWLQWTQCLQARGQTSMLCRIKGRHEALRQSLFWPVTELARDWGRELCSALFFFFF